MQIVLGHDEDIAVFAAKKLGIQITPPFTAMGVADDDGVLHGAMIFNNFNGFNIELTVYGPGLFQRRFMRAAYEYVFNQLKCTRMTCRSARKNKKTRILLQKLGFEYEGTMQRYFGPNKQNDAVLFRLDPDAARKWLEK